MRQRSRDRDAGQPASPQSRSRWRQQSRLAKTGYIIAMVIALVVVVAGVGGYAEYRHLEGNITVVKVGGLTGRTIYGAQNILVLGSQTRAGQHGHFFGMAPGANKGTSNSDNLLIVHLDPTHTHAIIMSIPRDTFVYEPGCPARNSTIGYGIQGPYVYPPGNLIDGALNIGGPTCAVHTVEDLTGIKLDHYVEFNFNSFRKMVDTLGGVWVCVPPGRGYHDKASGVNLNPGRHLLKYNQALAYVRTRHILGGPDAGGDLPRIELQQAFISSLVQKVNSEGLLSNIPQLLSIADTATKALTVDKSLGSVPSLLHLARSLTRLKTKNVTLITMPTTMDTYDYPTYDQHLMTLEPQDDVLFGMIINGQDWHGQLPTEPHAQVQVRVLNATGRPGLAARTANRLRKLGFDVIKVGDAPYTGTTTVSYAGIAQADSAYTLMKALTNFPAGQNLLTEPASQLGSAGPVTLTLGTDFAGVQAAAQQKPGKAGKSGKSGQSGSGSGGSSVATAASQSGPSAVQSRNAAANICSGLPPANG